MKKLKEPAFMATEVAGLPDRDAGIEKAFVRMNTARISASGNDKRKFRRRQGILLINRDNGLKTVTFAMGGQLRRSAIAIDYDTRHALGMKYRDEQAQIEVRSASYLQVIRHFLNHQDLGYRLSIQLGLLGATLGALSILPDAMSNVVNLFF